MACVVGLFALTTLPRPTNVAALIPRVLFPAIMLAAFIAMTGRFAQALIGIGAARLVLTLAFIRTKNIGVSTGAHILNDWVGFTFVILSAAATRHGRADPNLARFCFLAESARSFYPDWNTAADVTVAILRAEAGSDPHDKDLHDLVGELSTRSDAFRAKWAAHNVRRHGTGTKTFVHPVRWRGAPGVRGPRSHRGPRTAVPDLHRPTRHRRRRTPRPTRQLGGVPGLGRTSSGTLDQRLAGVRLNTR